MTNWLEKTKRPVLPIYQAALVRPIKALLLPIYILCFFFFFFFFCSTASPPTWTPCTN